MSLLSPEFIARLERLQLISRRAVSSHRRGDRRSRRQGTGNEFADYRNYVAGDDLRFLDWKLFGRLEKLFIRRYRAEEDLQVTIILDVSQSMAFGEPSKLEHGKRLAAALGHLSLVQSDSVALVAFAENGRPHFGPRRGRRHSRELLAALDALEPGGTTNLAAVARRVARTAPSRSLVIFISDFLDFAGFQDAFRQLAARRLQIVAVQTVSPEEQDPELEGDLELRDSEYDRKAEISITPDLLAAYNRSARGYHAALRRFVQARGGVLLQTMTTDSLERSTLPAFRRAGLLR